MNGQWIKKLWLDESGVVTVEYALLIVLVVVVSIGAWREMQTSLTQAVRATETAWAR